MSARECIVLVHGAIFFGTLWLSGRLALEDVRHYRLPNKMVGWLWLLCAAHFSVVALGEGTAIFEVIPSFKLVVVLAVSISGVLLYGAGFMGGGDVKILPLPFIWMPSGQTMAEVDYQAIFLCFALVGAVYQVSFRHIRGLIVHRGEEWGDGLQDKAVMPYGPVILVPLVLAALLATYPHI